MRIHIGKISPSLAERIDELEKRLDRYGKREDMDIDQKQYGALRTAFNGLMFRQSKLELKQARPSYFQQVIDEASKSTTTAPKKNPEQIKRLRSHPSREIGVFPGRNRESSKTRETPTFRVEIKGEIRKPKIRKRKLWGVEKRPLNKLVNHFVDGEWRDAEGKAVEVIAELHDKHACDARIAEDLAKQAGFISDSDFEEFKESAKDIDPADYLEDDIEIVPRGFVPQNSIHTVKLDDDNDEPMEESNTTENLRSALSGGSAPFTLFGGAPETEEVEEEEVAVPDVVMTDVVTVPSVGLFFGHRASPYLRSQTQAVKLVAEFDPKQWESEFFEKRGEWNRELRKRRRDALRMARRMGKKRGE